MSRLHKGTPKQLKLPVSASQKKTETEGAQRRPFFSLPNFKQIPRFGHDQTPFLESVGIPYSIDEQKKKIFSPAGTLESRSDPTRFDLPPTSTIPHVHRE